MNRTKIEWTQLSWNPIVGCSHGCWYCYAIKLARRFPRNFPNGFKPSFYPERLYEPWDYKKPSKIFVCSVADLFAAWTAEEWRDKVLESAEGCPVDHVFQLLTKNPERIPEREFPENFWIGCTVTNEAEDWKNIEEIKKVRCGVRFASFEPLLGALPEYVDLFGLEWIIIGKLTGSRRVELDPVWVWDIVKRAQEFGIPVFMKNNLGFPSELKIQEFPI